MNDFNILLKYFKRLGYPNKNLLTIFKSLDYDEKNFLTDLVENLGQAGADEFIQKTIDKLSTPKGIKIDLEEYGYPESYFYLIIVNFSIDLEETEEGGFLIGLTYSKVYNFLILFDALGFG
jgi:hypothetical protein